MMGLFGIGELSTRCAIKAATGLRYVQNAPGSGKGIMVAATKQHTGKTSVSLGLLSGLKKIFPERVSFMKPVGHSYVTIDGIMVCV